eukprot:15453974-Alexandrium_andersonii.AAC.1
MASGCGLKRPQAGQWQAASGGNASARTRWLSCSAMSACLQSAQLRMALSLSLSARYALTARMRAAIASPGE